MWIPFLGFFPHLSSVCCWLMSEFLYDCYDLLSLNAYHIRCCASLPIHNRFSFHCCFLLRFQIHLVIQKQYITAFYIVTGDHHHHHHHHMTLVIWKIKAFDTEMKHIYLWCHQAKLVFIWNFSFETIVKWNVKRPPQHIFYGISTRFKKKNELIAVHVTLSWLYGYVFEVLIIIVVKWGYPKTVIMTKWSEILHTRKTPHNSHSKWFTLPWTITVIGSSHSA